MACVVGEGVSGWRRRPTATRLRAPRPPRSPGLRGGPRLSGDLGLEAARRPRLAGTCRYQTRLPRSLPGLWEELPEGRRPAPSAPPRASSRAAGATGKGPASGSGGQEARSRGEKRDPPGKVGALGGPPRAPFNLKYVLLMSAGFRRPDGRTRKKD